MLSNVPSGGSAHHCRHDHRSWDARDAINLAGIGFGYTVFGLVGWRALWFTAVYLC